MWERMMMSSFSRRLNERNPNSLGRPASNSEERGSLRGSRRRAQAGIVTAAIARVDNELKSYTSSSISVNL